MLLYSVFKKRYTRTKCAIEIHNGLVCFKPAITDLFVHIGAAETSCEHINIFPFRRSTFSVDLRNLLASNSCLFSLFQIQIQIQIVWSHFMMNISPIFTLLLALVWSPPTPEQTRSSVKPETAANSSEKSLWVFSTSNPLHTVTLYLFIFFNEPLFNQESPIEI